jgi:hypothetical protein
MMYFKKMNNKIYIFFAGLLLFAGCDREEEPVPAYLTVQPFELKATNPAAHGSISEKIANASMFLLNDDLKESRSLGNVALPANIPVLTEGEWKLNIDPVIKANGNSYFLQAYPFYERFITTVNFQPNEDVTVKPVTTYKDDCVFEFIEDFEGAGHLFTIDRDDNPKTFLESSKDDVFEGEFSGKILLDTANYVFVATTNTLYQLTFDQGGKFFMEVNYKTPVPLEFGLIAIDNQGVESPNFEFVVLPKDEWNKIYFDMTDLVATSSANRFVFAIRAGIPFENKQFTLDKAEIFLDNIKLVHF